MHISQLHRLPFCSKIHQLNSSSTIIQLYNYRALLSLAHSINSNSTLQPPNFNELPTQQTPFRPLAKMKFQTLGLIFATAATIPTTSTSPNLQATTATTFT